MKKKILTPTDGSKASLVSIDYAVDIAKLFDAKITGLSVIDIKRLTGPFIHDIGTSIGGMVPYGSFRETIENMLNIAAESALIELEGKCKAKDIQYELKKVEGIITKEITKLANDVDLISMGRTGDHTQWSDTLLGSNLESVVRQTHKPVLVTSEKNITITKMLIAYGGSECAGKALNIGCEIAGRMQIPVTILTVGDDKEQVSKILSDAEKLIKQHKVDYETSSANGDPVDVILNRYAEGHYNILVMGAYGHSKIRELVLGSTTAKLMRNVECPILICR